MAAAGGGRVGTVGAGPLLPSSDDDDDFVAPPVADGDDDGGDGSASSASSSGTSEAPLTTDEEDADGAGEGNDEDGDPAWGPPTRRAARPRRPRRERMRADAVGRTRLRVLPPRPRGPQRRAGGGGSSGGSSESEREADELAMQTLDGERPARRAVVRPRNSVRARSPPIAAYGPPGTWLAATKPWLAPYLPQVGDDVVYLPVGHRLFVQAFPPAPDAPALPWDVCDVAAGTLRPVEWGRVSGRAILMDPGRWGSATLTGGGGGHGCGCTAVVWVPGAPASCRVTLDRHAAPDNAGPAAATLHPAQLTVQYHDAEGVSEFLLLQARYRCGQRVRMQGVAAQRVRDGGKGWLQPRAACATDYTPGQAVWAIFGSGDALTWYAGTVLEARADPAAGPWERYLVGWCVTVPAGAPLPSQLSLPAGWGSGAQAHQ
jgi:hypothetical protein